MVVLRQAEGAARANMAGAAGGCERFISQLQRLQAQLGNATGT